MNLLRVNRFSWAGMIFSVAMSAISAYATADGPDFYRLQSTPSAKPLALSAAPGVEQQTIGVLPAQAVCLRSKGCKGGLTLEEFTTLPESEKRARLDAQPRWCQIEYRGQMGWVPGQFLAEDACADPPATPVVLNAGSKPQTVTGAVHGYGTAVYRVKALAGQTLAVTLAAKHPQTYFNVDPAGKEEAMFIGSTSGNTMRRRVPADGDYMVTVYLMRATARRGSASNYTLSAAVSGQPLAAVSNTKDALVPGTQFHATATVSCKTSFDPSLTRCAAGVIRRGLDGTATVEVQMHQGVRRVLFVKGKLVASDSAQQINTTRNDDSIKVRVGDDESFEFADVFLKGD